MKPDKWNKMYAVEENKAVIKLFVDTPEPTTLIAYINFAGALTVTDEWPSNLKSKASYFVKKVNDVIPVSKDVPMRNMLLYGDVSANPIDQLSVFVDEVGLLLFEVTSLW